MDAPSAATDSGNQEEPGAVAGEQDRQFAQDHSYIVRELFGLHMGGQTAGVCSTPES